MHAPPQFEANSYQLGGVAQSDIFQGVAIFVNGYTQPTHAELRQLMLLHGGRFENYFYPQHVTHIVCSNLPDTKLKQLAHARDPIPIVRPDWWVCSESTHTQTHKHTYTHTFYISFLVCAEVAL